MKNRCVVILGPTSSGKTTLALELCKKMGGEIISADSRQIYRDMHIGTGKIPTSHQGKALPSNDDPINVDGVTVWGYNLVNPDEYFSAFDYAKYALQKAREIFAEDKTAFLVGGTGFYIDMFLGNVKASSVSPDFEMRRTLEKKDLPELVNELSFIAPNAVEKIDIHNKARVLRALEKVHASHKSEEVLNYLEEIKFTAIGLTADRSVLYGRADAWVEKIWDSGLVEETKKLLINYPKSDKLSGLIYNEVLKHLKDGMTREEAIQKTKFALHAYIRRQQTYFKKMKIDYWIDISQDNALQNVYNIING